MPASIIIEASKQMSLVGHQPATVGDFWMPTLEILYTIGRSSHGSHPHHSPPPQNPPAGSFYLNSAVMNDLKGHARTSPVDMVVHLDGCSSEPNPNRTKILTDLLLSDYGNLEEIIRISNVLRHKPGPLATASIKRAFILAPFQNLCDWHNELHNSKRGQTSEPNFSEIRTSAVSQK